MKISVFGTGYVGLVTGVCFAEMGNDVICSDIDKSKIDLLNRGQSPIFEKGLEAMIKSNADSGRLKFTTSLADSIAESDLLFIAVGTPSEATGAADLTAVESVARFIGKHLQSFKVIVNKSTVPVGTQKKVKSWIREELNRRNMSIDFEVVSNPEFLREGIAVEDCLKPARVIIGAEHEEAIKIVRRLYEPFVKNGNPIWVMSPESAELSKYAANTMLAAKISMMNELSRLAYQTGADIEDVRKAVGSDPRIGPHFLFAGVGYGGSCFPKDVRALVNMGEKHQSEMFLMKAIDETNRSQRVHFGQRIKARVGGLQGKVWAHWGSSFKPGTDDIRESPALDLIHQALSEGATVHLFDPASAMKIQSYFQEHPRLKIFKEQYEALQGADFLVLTTEWKSFREPNFEKIKNSLKQPLLFDGRNIWNPSLMKELGFEYHSIGRPNI